MNEMRFYEMIKKSEFQNHTNDAIKIIIYMVFLTLLFMVYCSNNNDEFETSVDNYHSYEAVVSTLNNNTTIQTRIEDKIKEGYIVWNDNCQIPNISAFDPSVKNVIKKTKAPKCSSIPPLTSVVLDVDSWTYTFKINLDLNLNISSTIVNCCYSSIVRNQLKFKKTKTDDDRYVVEPKCHLIKDSEIIPKSVEYMLVKCNLRPKYGKIKSRSTVYKDIHAMVIDKGQRRFWNANISDKPSVLLLSIDSLSRLNLIRSMPITHRLLETRGFLSLEGYTKVADNTFPNVVPILTGMFEAQMVKRCWKKPDVEMDECPFLWKEFNKRGYVTAYVEDEPSISTFNFGKYGFRNAPTDYYSRPYMLAAERFLPVIKYHGMHFCVGPRSVPDRVFGYIEDFVQLHRRHGYFAVFWLNSFSHNDLNTPSSMDRMTADLLSRLLDGRSLDNAVTVVLSDHGMRFGEIRETNVGWLEERMPTFYARLPPSYVAARPDHRVALAANKNRLTSPFDFHLTLKQLLFGDQPTEVVGCPTCRSLFHPANANRSCEQAGIVSHWCTCNAYEELDKLDEMVAAGGKYVVEQLNKLLVKYRSAVKNGYVCSELSLSKTVSVRSRAVDRLTGGRREYLVIVETLPGRSMFEVTVGQSEPGGALDVLGDISRINMYGFQSHCTNDWKLKKHCYCVKDKRKSGGG